MIKLSQTSRKAWLLAIVCCVVMLPFLGLADYNTKGEPRESVVSYTILESGNWILPTNNGGEMPYKPPMFHWCIAAVSMLNGGEVTECTSRIPSALALIAMTVAVFVFYARRRGDGFAMCVALMTFTTFELHRAGGNCRVDMLLTAVTVGALFSFYAWYERKLKGLPWVAILLMSIGTLTKGPVGMLIPCLVTGVFLLFERINFFKAFYKVALCGMLSLVLPALWYIAAYQQGGQEFLDLVMEENFGRMTNTMSYDSCVNPWPYNIATLLGGFVPWTLAVVFMLFVLPYKKLKMSWPTAKTLPEIPAVNLFSGIAAITIFVFYCIPQSKRSVYLMPMYPFTAYFVTMVLLWISRQRGTKLVKVFGDIMASVAILLTICFVVIKIGIIPDSIFGHGRHAAQNVAMLNALRDASNAIVWLSALVSPVFAVLWFVKFRKHDSAECLINSASAVIMAIYISMAGAFQPAVLNAKSHKDIARQIDAVAPQSEGNLYEFIELGEIAAGDPIHYFEINFYLGDRILNFLKEKPQSGFLIIGDDDAAKYMSDWEAQGYQFEPCFSTTKRIIGQPTKVYKFQKNDFQTGS